LAIVPKTKDRRPHTADRNFKSLHGTFLTGEMFAPILREQIEKLNALTGSQFYVLAVPNTYFGGDVAVAGLLTGQDFLAVKDKIKGDFAVIPKTVIKSDEPILLDGMRYDDLKAQFGVPIYDMDAQEFIAKILADDF
jgi:NifB/MoaA-like Fe-S oxidoreductase